MMDNTPATRSHLRALAKVTGFTAVYDRYLDEFRICRIGADEATAYYTSDVQDAFLTLKAMVSESYLAGRGA
jgi:hypothetical protein